MIEDFDEILDKCGGYGKYQNFVSFGLIIPTSFLVAMTVNVKIFQTIVPTNYWCDVPGMEATGYTPQEWMNLSSPRLDDGTYDRCSYHEILQASPLVISNETKECTKWSHDVDEMGESFAVANNWFCQKKSYSSNLMSYDAAGNAIGTFVLPLMADRFTGKFRMFFTVLTWYVITSLLMLSTSSYQIISALFFCRGLAFQTTYQMPYVIGLELVPPEYREVVSFGSFIAWTFSMCLISFLAWLLPHWIYLTFLGSGFALIMFGYYWILPESPRWLLAGGRIDECTEILAKMAQINEASITKEHIKKELLSIPETDSSKVTINELLKYPRIIRNILVLSVQSFIAFTVYGCILLNVKIIPDNYYLSFFIMSISELPSNFTSWLGTKYIGRRGLITISTMISLISAIAAMFVTSEYVLLIFLNSVMKLASTNGLFVVYLMSSEVSPTKIRSTAMGFIILLGMSGSIFAPQIITLSPVWYYGVLAVLSAFGFLFGLFIPETMGLPLPQTFPEAETIGRGVPFWKWINYWNWQKYAPVSQDSH